MSLKLSGDVMLSRPHAMIPQVASPQSTATSHELPFYGMLSPNFPSGKRRTIALGEQVKTGQLRSLQNRPVEGRRRTLCNGSTRRNKRARIGDLSNTLSIPFALSPAVRGQLRPPGFTGAAAPAASPEQRGAAPGQGAACKRRDRATRARRLLGSARRGSQSADSWSARSVRVRKLLGPHLSTLA